MDKLVFKENNILITYHEPVNFKRSKIFCELMYLCHDGGTANSILIKNLKYHEYSPSSVVWISDRCQCHCFCNQCLLWDSSSIHQGKYGTVGSILELYLQRTYYKGSCPKKNLHSQRYSAKSFSPSPQALMDIIHKMFFFFMYSIIIIFHTISGIFSPPQKLTFSQWTRVLPPPPQRKCPLKECKIFFSG